MNEIHKLLLLEVIFRKKSAFCFRCIPICQGMQKLLKIEIIIFWVIFKHCDRLKKAFHEALK